MRKQKYVVQVIFGSVRMGQPTGAWQRDDAGWWRPVYTDTVWLDEQGRETRRAPYECLIATSAPFNTDGTPIPLPKQRSGLMALLLGKGEPMPAEVFGY